RSEPNVREPARIREHGFDLHDRRITQRHVMTEREVRTFLEGFFVEQSRRHAVVESSHDTRLRVAGNDLVRTIPLPQRLARARLYEAQRSRDELQEKSQIEGEPGRQKRA